MPRTTDLTRTGIALAIGTAACAVAALSACAPASTTSTPSSSPSVSQSPRASTDPIEHEAPVDPTVVGTGLSVVSLAEADTAGTHEASPWSAGDPLPDYLERALSHEAPVVDPASLSRIVATHGVEAWIGTGVEQLAGKTCIVEAQSQIPVVETSCVDPAEFEAKGAAALLRLPNGTQALEARVLPERARGTGIVAGMWEAPNDRILLLAKPPTVDSPEVRVPTGDGSAPIIVGTMG
ncbi:hypothetical protein [Leucobacter iarius]|uniref:Uncharacterized protein n=1 Tax=Leucobacter iarius TaxID=333963 RepID=A0ABP4XY63_9MICO